MSNMLDIMSLNICAFPRHYGFQVYVDKVSQFH
jgi:hypothetical protein